MTDAAPHQYSGPVSRAIAYGLDTFIVAVGCASCAAVNASVGVVLSVNTIEASFVPVASVCNAARLATTLAALSLIVMEERPLPGRGDIPPVESAAE